MINYIAQAISIEYGPPVQGEYHCLENGKIVIWNRSERQPTDTEIVSLVRKHKAAIDAENTPLPTLRELVARIAALESR